MLFQSLAVLPNHVVEAQVQLVEGEGLLRVGGSLPRGVVVGLLRTQRPSVPTRGAGPFAPDHGLTS